MRVTTGDNFGHGVFGRVGKTSTVRGDLGGGIKRCLLPQSNAIPFGLVSRLPQSRFGGDAPNGCGYPVEIGVYGLRTALGESCGLNVERKKAFEVPFLLAQNGSMSSIHLGSRGTRVRELLVAKIAESLGSEGNDRPTTGDRVATQGPVQPEAQPQGCGRCSGSRTRGLA
jgi:hypothetical protein